MDTVSYKHSEFLPLTEKQEAELKLLSAQPDSKIDYSDIGEPTQALWEKAARGQFYANSAASLDAAEFGHQQ